MDADTRSAIEGVRQEMRAGFARIDRYFELGQAQYQQLQQETHDGFAAVDRRFAAVDRRFDSVDARIDSVEAQISSLRSELHTFRDWVTEQFAELRTWLRDLIRRVGALEQR